MSLQEVGEFFDEGVVLNGEAFGVGDEVVVRQHGIAASRPMAVAISASAMPGATLEMLALCAPPMAMKEFMMPYTVPSRPM